ncbi:Cell envelope-associated transcriptional attenuator LytR-CpsA-Psr, subfamily F1 [Streptococcus sp. DD10]|nr:Cell envelope-associated transcriptional attenuator LytR-CpsA-Psr, subfamily F1 [Streptococcus sp. DD10]
MSDKTKLSHHEQLRYDYLYKNFHYLNEREKEELLYLQQKMDEQVPYHQSNQVSEMDRENKGSNQSYSRASKGHAGDTLPRYGEPKKEKRRNRNLKKLQLNLLLKQIVPSL